MTDSIAYGGSILRRILLCLAAGVALLLVAAAPVHAAPQLGVTLERDSDLFPTVHHSDDRIDFTATVKNIAPVPGAPGEGERLSCATDRALDWLSDSSISYGFEFRWLRDGAPITPWAPADEVVGSVEVSTYTVQAADAGRPIQCLVKATNGAGTGSYLVASLPAVVAAPEPAVAPPAPNDIGGAGSNTRRPAISGTASEAGETLTCTAPTTGWSESNEDSPITWSFEWLRDGEPAPGTVTPLSATESQYELTAEDVSAPAAPGVFQCIAKATNDAGQSVIVESPRVPTTAPAPSFGSGEEGQPAPPFFRVPKVENPINTTSGPITLEVGLPAGQETFVLRTQADGWSCETLPASASQPARAVCSREDPISPGEEYPPLTVIAGLGADAPDTAIATATAVGGGADTATAELSFPIEPAIPFGLSTFTAPLFDHVGDQLTQAGGHPFQVISELAVNQKRSVNTDAPDPGSPALSHMRPIEQLRQVIAELPPGFVGNPRAVPELCPGVGVCPARSKVGLMSVRLNGLAVEAPIYALEPERGVPAQFFFLEPVSSTIITFSASLRTGDGYALSLSVSPAGKVDFLDSVVTFCGFGVKEDGSGCAAPGDPGAFEKPFLTAPTRCGVPLETRVHANSWADPTFVDGPTFTGEPIEGCDQLEFDPEIDFEPTSTAADTPTGLDVELTMPTEGLEDPDGLAQANLKLAEVTLPAGMAINPAAAGGLAACSPAQIGIDPQTGIPNDEPVRCPDAAKIGTVEVETPLIEETLRGAIYQATQDLNPFDSTFAIYVVAESKERGLLIKLAGEVSPDPQTGRLTTSFDDNPQLPFSRFHLHFKGGSRAPLVNPPTCGTKTVHSRFTPWSAADPEHPTAAETVQAQDSFEVTSGPGGSACAATPGDRPFEPRMSAGVTDPVAGAQTPFVFRLTREDGHQEILSTEVTPPEGVTAKLAGIPFCSDANAAAGSCGPESRVGTAISGAGAGPNPFYITNGEVFLAGPYKGAPLSLVIEVSAVAGPFDLGTVVVRAAVHVDPRTAQLTVTSDRIPQILEGVPLRVRDIRVVIDRPGFSIAPTDCSEKQVLATAVGSHGARAELAERFQVGGCEELGFSPKFGFKAKEGRRATKRNFHPTLEATVSYPQSQYEGEGGVAQANIDRVAVTLPKGMFLDQDNLSTICTRAQFAAEDCPEVTKVGDAEAHSPLLDEPLSGSVYLIASDNKLPDLVADLNGIVGIDLYGRIDQSKRRIRNTFEVVPDVPVSDFRLTIDGGRNEGLLVNSLNTCRRKALRRVNVRVFAQNGMTAHQRTLVKAPCKSKKRKLRRKARQLRRKAHRLSRRGDEAKAQRLMRRAQRVARRAKRA